MVKKAIIACEVLYNEIEEIIEDKDIDVDFLPQGLHDLQDSTKMRDKIQEIIDKFEEKDDYDYIILGYGYCSGGVEGLKAENATLVIPRVHDCIPILLGDPETKGNIDNGKTYFLSRGWIDCGGDTYKEYLYIIDKMDDLIHKFEEYQQNSKALVSWYEKDRYEIDRHYPEDTAKYVSFECLKNYESITLIDNDNLEQIHRDYTEEMYEFIDELLRDNRGEGLECKVINGHKDFLQDLINVEDLNEVEENKNYLVTSPGQYLKMEEQILD